MKTMIKLTFDIAPVASILNAIGETNWIYNLRTTRLLTDLMTEIKEEMNKN